MSAISRGEAYSGGFGECLEAARSGEPDACRWIWDRFAGPVAGFLRARGTPEADEVLNDAFVAAFAGLDGFDPSGGEPAFRAWLFGIARHKRIDALRARARRPFPVDGARVERQFGDVEAEAIAALADDELRAVLDDLTPDQRDVIVLRFVVDLSLEQVGAALNKPTGAVKALQHRALDQLRQKFVLDPYPQRVPVTK